MLSHREVIEAAYLGILKREADPAIETYIQLLDAKQISLSEILSFFMGLDEAYARAEPNDVSKAIALLYSKKGSSLILGNPFYWQNNPKSLVFYHFPKTGGISLSNYLASHFHPFQIPRGIKSDLGFQKYFMGHYLDWSEYMKVPQPNLTITCLRNPSTRLRSLFGFLAAIAGTADVKFKEAAQLAANHDFHGFFDSKNPNVINIVNNAYVRSLSGFLATVDNDPLRDSPDLALDIAIKRLLNFQMIYLLEELQSNAGCLPDRILKILNEYFFKQLDPLIPRLNEAPKPQISSNIASNFIEKNTYLDNILYDRISSILGLDIRSY